MNTQQRLVQRPSNDNDARRRAREDATRARHDWEATADRLRWATREFGADSVTAMRALDEERRAFTRWDAAETRFVGVVRGGSL